MMELIALGKCVEEDGLVGHHWEEILGPVKVLCPSRGECQAQELGMGGLGSRGDGGEDREFLERKLGKGITFEM